MFIQNIKTETIIAAEIAGPTYSYLPANPGDVGQVMVMDTPTKASWAALTGGDSVLKKGDNIDITTGEGETTISLKNDITIDSLTFGGTTGYTIPPALGLSGEAIMVSTDGTKAGWGALPTITAVGENIIVSGEYDRTVDLNTDITVATLNIGADSENIEYSLPTSSGTAGNYLGVPNSGNTLAWRDVATDLSSKSGGVSLQGLSIKGNGTSNLYSLPTSLNLVTAGSVLTFVSAGAELKFTVPSVGKNQIHDPNEDLINKSPLLTYVGNAVQWQKNIYQSNFINSDDATANRLILGEDNYSMLPNNVVTVGHNNSLAIPNSATPTDPTSEQVDFIVVHTSGNVYEITGFASQDTEQYSSFILSQCIGIDKVVSNEIEYPDFGYINGNAAFIHVGYISGLSVSDTTFTFTGGPIIPAGVSFILRCQRYISKKNYSDTYGGETINFKNTTVVGCNNIAQHHKTTVVGAENTVSSHSCTILGANNITTGYNNVAIGNDSVIGSGENVAIGVSNNLGITRGATVGSHNTAESQSLVYIINLSYIINSQYQTLLTDLINGEINITNSDLYDSKLLTRQILPVTDSSIVNGVYTITTLHNYVLSIKLSNIMIVSKTITEPVILGQFITTDYDIVITYNNSQSGSTPITVTIDNIDVYDNGKFSFTPTGTNITNINITFTSINPDVIADSSFIGGHYNTVNSCANVIGTENAISEYSARSNVLGHNNEIIGASPWTNIIGFTNLVVGSDDPTLLHDTILGGVINISGTQNNVRAYATNIFGSANFTSGDGIKLAYTNNIGNNNIFSKTSNYSNVFGTNNRISLLNSDPAVVASNIVIIGTGHNIAGNSTNSTILGNDVNRINNGTNVAIINSSRYILDGSSCTNATIIGATQTTGTPPSNTVSVNGLHNRGAKYVSIENHQFDASLHTSNITVNLSSSSAELYYILSSFLIFNTVTIIIEGANEKIGRTFDVIFNVNEDLPPSVQMAPPIMASADIFSFSCYSGNKFLYKSTSSPYIFTSTSSLLTITRNSTPNRPLKNTIRFTKIALDSWLIDQPLDVT